MLNPHRRGQQALSWWSVWRETDHERGWPGEAAEVRAFEAYMRSTETAGAARYRGTVQLGSRRVRKVAPVMPHSTRAAARSQVPRGVDRDVLGARVNGVLVDCAMQGHWWASATRLAIDRAQDPSATPHRLAQRHALKITGYYMRLNHVYAYVARALDVVQP